MQHRFTPWTFVALLVLLAPAASHAGPYDLIFADSIDVVSPPEISGFLLGSDVLLLVNTGASGIGAAELYGATFTATTSDPAVTATAFVNDPGLPVAPILPLEAVGTLEPGSPLLARVLPGESVRNTSPLQVFALGVDYPAGYIGTVVISITMTMGIDVADYYALVNIRPGSVFGATTAHASRVSSQSFPTATRATTWGAIKGRYR